MAVTVPDERIEGKPIMGRAPEAIFTIFLLLIFVGVSPFSPVDSYDSYSDGAGNTFRQLSYILIGIAAAFLHLRAHHRPTLTAVPFSTAAVLLLVILSTAWSVSPELTLRRSVLVTIVTCVAFLSVDLLGPTKSIRILKNVLGLVILVDLVSVPLITHATHSYQGMTVWAGMHGHKNTAGAVASMSAILFWHFWVRERRVIDCALFLLSVVFLVGTRSKTALALLVILIAMGQIYLFCEKTKLRQQMFRALLFGAVIFALIVLSLFYEEIALVLSDPQTLTGRLTIWRIVLDYAPQNILTGSGYGAFWEGVNAPARQYISEQWLLSIGHAHNSYLEILATLGIPGLVLSLYAFAIMPLYKTLKFRVSSGMGSLAFCWILFGIVGNVTKSQFLDRDNPEWFIIVLSIAIVCYRATKPSLTCSQQRLERFPD